MPVYRDSKTNKWYYEFNYKTASGESKRRKKRGFEKKIDAKDAEAAEKIKLKDAPPSKLTFSQLYNLYVEAKTHEWLPGTERKLRGHIEQHVLPVFRDVPLEKITTKSVEDWKTSMYNKTHSGKKYKVSTLNGIRKDFSAIINYAINHRFVTFNPVRAVTSFKDPQSSEVDIEKQVWSPEEYAQFMSVVDNNKWYVFFSFLWSTGVRIGEAQGVMYRDINFKNKTVTICKSIDTKQKGIPYVINPTKTKKTRILELPSKFIELLKPYYESGKNIDGWSNDKFLFGFDRPLPNSTIDKARNNYIELSGVKKISSHCFRHSHATYLLSNGIDIKSVSERLGHKDVQETLNTYVHVLPNNKSKIIDLMDKSFENYSNFTPQEKETA